METATFSAQLKLGQKGPSDVYLHHKENWGNPNTFGYIDFIPMFKGEKFNADEWIDLFQKAGAKYVIPVAEHHDGFAMYKSNVTRWNAYEMGPKKDVPGELFKAGRVKGMVPLLILHLTGLFITRKINLILQILSMLPYILPKEKF